MRRALLISLFQFLVLASAYTQFGIKGSYHHNQPPYWTITAAGNNESAELLADGFSAGIDYWFRLKNLRIEFLPELNYGRFNQNFSGQSLNLTSNSQFFSLFANVNFYFLDFKGDCDCPTFSKQGPTLNKGIFFQLSPGLSYLMHDATLTVLTPDSRPDAPPGQFSDNDIALSLGAGLGVDIGLSDLLTITPFAGLRYFPQLNRNSLNAFTPENCNCSATADRAATSLLQFSAGLRLGLRLDD